MNRDIRLWTCAIAASISLMFGIAIVSAAQSTNTRGVVGSKTLLDTIDLSIWNPRSLIVSPNIRSVAYIQRSSDKKVQIVRNGRSEEHTSELQSH